MFTDNLSRWIEGVRDYTTQYTMRKIIEPLFNAESSMALTVAGLVITGVGGTTAKLGASAFYGVVNGVIVTLTASTAMPALSGVVLQGTFNVYCFFIDSAGVTTSAMGVAGSALGLVKFPPFPSKKALIGFVIVNPTGGNFTGGTTPLDDATAVPHAAFISPTGGLDPACLIG